MEDITVQRLIQDEIKKHQAEKDYMAAAQSTSGDSLVGAPGMSNSNVHSSSNGRLDVLRQIVSGPVWDGHIISKTDRDELVGAGIATRSCGFNIITEKGIEYALNLGLLRK
jgi:hypothetical protein